ncbi:hypothetical protein L2E82_44295 [Cichorium intybus]|uniref:Uncharacterized protein n=1 Tax=Cichorium intybus TaxID=13427 RepID=A0ACB8ZQ49_CICIN|nr:hypothetical protein L2E82_44295 [Cichorium intybus]
MLETVKVEDWSSKKAEMHHQFGDLLVCIVMGIENIYHLQNVQSSHNFVKKPKSNMSQKLLFLLKLYRQNLHQQYYFHPIDGAQNHQLSSHQQFIVYIN